MKWISWGLRWTGINRGEKVRGTLKRWFYFIELWIICHRHCGFDTSSLLKPQKTKTKFEYVCSEPNGNNDAAGFPHLTLAAVYKPTYKHGLSTWQTMASGSFVSKCHKTLPLQLGTWDCGCPQMAPQLLWISLPHVWLWRRLLHAFDCSGDLCGFYQLDVATRNWWDQVLSKYDCSLHEASVAVCACVNKNPLNQFLPFSIWKGF